MPQTPENWRPTQLVSTEDGITNLTNDQFDPKIIHLASGNILVVYSSNADVGAGSPASTDIVGRLYNSLGEPQGDEFLINTAINQSGSERDVEIAALPNGGFVAVYEDVHGGEATLRLQEYNADGTFDFSGVTIIDASIDGTPTFSNPNVSVSASNRVLVTYEVDNGNGDVDLVRKTYNPQNDSYSDAATIFDGGSGNGEGFAGHSVTTLTGGVNDGAYVVVFSDQDGPAGDDDDIYFNIVQQDGTIGGNVLVYDGLTDSSDPHVTALTDGGFVITWVADSSGGTNTGIRARVYNESGAPVTSTFIPNDTTDGNQLAPVAASLQDGGFVLVWLDAPTADIHGQRFDASGNPVGDEFDIDTDVAIGVSAGGIDIDVEGMADGRIAVTWTESPAAGGLVNNDTDVHMAIWDPRDGANPENVYIGDQVIGTVGDDIINMDLDDRRAFGWDGDDRFNFEAGEAGPFEFVDGGEGHDTLALSGNNSVDFSGTFLTSIEELQYSINFGNGAKTASFAASQLGNGLADDLQVVGYGNSPGTTDILEFDMFGQNSIDLSNLQFVNWNATHDFVRINGDGSSETMVGTAGRDSFVGNAGNDTFTGNAGNDRLNGGTGSDTMIGGTGDDTYVVDTLSDVVTELVGEGLDTVESTVSYILGANVENLDLIGIGNIDGLGNQLANRIEGNNGANGIAGGNGNDLLIGNGGNDSLDGQNGADIMRGGTGSDGYHVDRVDDVVEENFNGGEYDILRTAVSYTLPDNVEILIMKGGAANPIDGTGNDGVGNNIQNLMLGNDSANVLETFGGNDVILGQGGNDTIMAGDGNDNIAGGLGLDILTGGGGADLFNFTNIGEGGDTITDFTMADSDLLDLRAMFDTFAGGAAMTTASAQASGHLTVTQLGADTAVYADATGGANNNVLIAVLEGTNTTAEIIDDFILV